MDKKERIIILPQNSSDILPSEIESILQQLDSEEFSFDDLSSVEPVTGERLLCPSCQSSDLDWSHSVDDDEYFFDCFSCNKRGFIDGETFRKALIDERERVFW